MATGTITCKGKGGWGAAAQSLGGGVLGGSGSGRQCHAVATCRLCAAFRSAAGTGGLLSDPVFFPISI